MDVQAMTDTELAETEVLVRSEMIRRQNIAVVERELAALQATHRENGLTPFPEEGDNWRQPTGAHDAYAANDIVEHGGKRWRSLVAYNVWEPGVSGWREYVPEPETDDPTLPVTPTVADWVQPTGAHDAYATGEKVRYGGKVYASLVDANVWAPDAYPAGWQEVAP